MVAKKESRQGKIREDKTRVNLTMEKTLKAQLEQLAEEDSRSLNSLVIHLLKKAISEMDK